MSSSCYQNATNGSKSDLDTPCLVMDLDMLERNLTKMQTTVDKARKQLRPHAKTHKCSQLARKQIEGGAIGICVAKVAEAEALVQAGLHQILVTGPLATPHKAQRLARLQEVAGSLLAVVDHQDGARLLNAACLEANVIMPVLIDIDIGLHRTGIAPCDATALGHLIVSLPALTLSGIQAYAGHVQHMKPFQTRRSASLECLQKAVPVFQALQALTPSCRIFSASGTGSYNIDIELPEVTELQAGSYVCMDADYASIGSAEEATDTFQDFEPAMRVLTTVVSGPHDHVVTVDAGLKALYRDSGMPRLLGEDANKYHYDWFGDEYGKITSHIGEPLPPIGTVLDIMASHCDPTVNLYNHVYLTRGQQVVDCWPIDLRGCSQ